MKRKLILLGLIIMLLSQGLCLNAEEQRLFYINGNKYLQLPGEIRSSYVLGLIDMWLHFSSFYSKDIEDQVKKMAGGQIKAIFEKYLQENPESLHSTAASLFSAAMLDALSKLK